MPEEITAPTPFYAQLFDEKGKPLFVRPMGTGCGAPVRIMTDEWIDMCHGWDDVTVLVHEKFTMTTEMAPIPGNRYDRSISLACPTAHPQWAVFGPYQRSTDRAIIKAGEYLVKNGVLVLLDMPEGADVGKWINEACQKEQREIEQHIAQVRKEREK